MAAGRGLPEAVEGAAQVDEEPRESAGALGQATEVAQGDRGLDPGIGVGPGRSLLEVAEAQVPFAEEEVRPRPAEEGFRQLGVVAERQRPLVQGGTGAAEG